MPFWICVDVYSWVNPGKDDNFSCVEISFTIIVWAFWMHDLTRSCKNWRVIGSSAANAMPNRSLVVIGRENEGPGKESLFENWALWNSVPLPVMVIHVLLSTRHMSTQ